MIQNFLSDAQSWAVVFWGFAIMGLGLVEFFTVPLISIWLIAGCCAALISCFFGASFELQILVFLVMTTLSLRFCGQFARIFLGVRHIRTNIDRIVGELGITSEDIDNIQGQGRIKICGLEYRARSLDGRDIDANEIVRVERIEGCTLIVRKA